MYLDWIYENFTHSRGDSYTLKLADKRVFNCYIIDNEDDAQIHCSLGNTEMCISGIPSFCGGVVFSDWGGTKEDMKVFLDLARVLGYTNVYYIWSEYQTGINTKLEENGFVDIHTSTNKRTGNVCHTYVHVLDNVLTHFNLLEDEVDF